ncbi:hypothetical protein OIU84_002398, partial [Salix udensis]
MYPKLKLAGSFRFSCFVILEEENIRQFKQRKKKKKIWDGIRGLLRLCSLAFVLFVGLASISLPGALGWSKEGHMMTCRIAQNLLGPEAANAVENLLPHNLNGDLSALCVWPDQIRHWYKYRWTSPLHFIDTPDNACTFDYSRDCVKDACVDGAIQNFTSQLLHYRDGTADRRYNLTEALLFLSHFMGDIHQVYIYIYIYIYGQFQCLHVLSFFHHNSTSFFLFLQPMHAGFTSDKGGNTVDLRWFRHKSNLHHVWDREIILTAL